MFDIGAQELLVIAVVAILFVRPKDLPGMLRTIGQYVGKLRAMAREFQYQFEEAARDSGVDDIKKGMSSIKDFSPTGQVKDAITSIGDDLEAVKTDVEAPPEEAAGDAPEETEPKPETSKKGPAAKKPAAKKPAAAARKRATPKKTTTPKKRATPKKAAASAKASEGSTG